MRMQSFRIKQLRVSGAGKIDGFIEFADGLNVIQGRSNTGKTWILKCIYYLFSSDKNPFSPLTGYSDIEGVFVTERYGDITIKRKLNDTQAEVICNNQEVEDGIYDTNYKGKGPLYLNDLWLRIIGLDETIRVPKNSRYARERISWTNIANVFFADEDEIDKSTSLVIKDSTYETALIASLYFLLTGDYKKAVKGLPANDVCPFCGGPVESHDESYDAAIQAETKRIVSELAVIAATENSVREEQAGISKNISELSSRRAEISEAIAERTLKINDYRTSLQRYRDYTKLQSGIDFVNEQLQTLGQKKVSELQKKKNPPLYHAKKEFEELVGTEFNELLNKILKECNYRAGYASWDFKTFDILMDGVSKEEDQGKGYRSFFNSVIALMLYEYFNSDEVFIKPGILMIDTPLLGFDENEDGIQGETLKNGLYQYFINHKGAGQVIIVDNLNVMPDIDLQAAGAKVTTYHKDEKDGHVYGFMPSWRKDLPKETE